jgi:hypothetical protein
MTEREAKNGTIVDAVTSFADSPSAGLHWERCWVASRVLAVGAAFPCSLYWTQGQRARAIDRHES